MVRAKLGWVIQLAQAAPKPQGLSFYPKRLIKLIQFTSLLLAKPFARERLFYAAFLSWLHIEAVLFYFFDDIFLLHFSLKTPQSVLQRFTFLNYYLCHAVITPDSADPISIGIISLMYKRFPLLSASSSEAATRSQGLFFSAPREL